jgi:hypothetical protein
MAPRACARWSRPWTPTMSKPTFEWFHLSIEVHAARRSLEAYQMAPTPRPAFMAASARSATKIRDHPWHGRTGGDLKAVVGDRQVVEPTCALRAARSSRTAVRLLCGAYPPFEFDRRAAVPDPMRALASVGCPESCGLIWGANYP